MGAFLIPIVLTAAGPAFSRQVGWEVVGFPILPFCLDFSFPAVFRSLPHRLLRLKGVASPLLLGMEPICIPVYALAVLGLQLPINGVDALCEASNRKNFLSPILNRRPPTAPAGPRYTQDRGKALILRR